MKRILLIILMVVALAGGANAQFSNFGIRGGVGLSTLADDLTKKTPIAAYAGGVYVTYDFSRLRSPMAYIFYLQGGVNVVRRGGKYSEVFTVAENMTSEHVGAYDAWYVQVPILANFHFEIPSRRRTVKQYGRVFLGPAVSYGIMGKFTESKVTPFQPQRDVNFKVHNASAFDYMNRLDIEAIIGVGYEYKNLNISLYVDHGFLSVIDEVDALRTIENNDQPVSHAGASLNAFMVSLGYRIPLNKEKK